MSLFLLVKTSGKMGTTLPVHPLHRPVILIFTDLSGKVESR